MQNWQVLKSDRRSIKELLSNLFKSVIYFGIKCILSCSLKMTVKLLSAKFRSKILSYVSFSTAIAVVTSTGNCIRTFTRHEFLFSFGETETPS